MPKSHQPTDQEIAEAAEILVEGREKSLQQLRAMIAGRGGGIDLDTPFHWAITGLLQPGPFSQHLPSLLPPDSILYVEGNSIVPEMAAFYSAHRAPNAVEVARDTIAPAPDIYHFVFAPQVSEQMRQLAGSHSVPEIFTHFKAYQGETLLLYWHDAFNNTLRICEHIAEDTVVGFCTALGASYRKEQTGPWRDPEQLREVLWSLV
jgi:hypothetical protein